MRLLWASLPALAFVGLADVAANGTYAIAAQNGPVTIAAVLANLYPVVTVIAALLFLKEQLRLLRFPKQAQSETLRLLREERCHVKACSSASAHR